ncbi:type I restriction enzyme HsdR N-terminal domain-containing protein [Rufibacter ruber]|uniref:type I restriction enzyme HsdR N-terminal domain-containing protein n=1 Tax=Rufibacter ruber TaxID=1783499 RepID=UPI0008372E29|nr:type I restriction enzyme HsdR N-terminal domain-containing protein [Rufibacter ruber]
MEQLSLPAFSYKLKESDGKTFIYDAVRRKWLVLTPEEWVRQHLLHFLHAYLQYPKPLMSVERGTRYNRLQKRTDICVYGGDGKVLLLVECKAPTVPISTQTVQQAAVYNQTIKAPYLLLSNGHHHYCWRVAEDGVSLEPLAELPPFDQLKKDGVR